MTPQERRLLEEFLGELMRVPAMQKDRAAAAAIDSAFERQPNAAYLVVQRALLLQQALEAAEAELAHIRGGAPATAEASAPRFLDPAAWGRRGPAMAAGGAGSFLGQAAAVAAGVAGGAFLLRGIDALTGEGWSDVEAPDLDAGLPGGDLLG